MTVFGQLKQATSDQTKYLYPEFASLCVLSKYCYFHIVIVILLLFVCVIHILARGNGTARNCISERFFCCGMQCCSSLASLLVQRVKRGGFLRIESYTLKRKTNF